MWNLNKGNTKKYTTFWRKRYCQNPLPPSLPWTPRALFPPPAMHLPNGKRYHLSSARRIRTASINNDDVRIHQQFFFTTFVFCQHNHQMPMEASFLPYFHRLILIPTDKWCIFYIYNYNCIIGKSLFLKKVWSTRIYVVKALVSSCTFFWWSCPKAINSSFFFWKLVQC